MISPVAKDDAQLKARVDFQVEALTTNFSAINGL